jgi:hypothetical protein
MALPFTLKGTLWQKKNYENSNILPYKNIIFKKSSKRNQNTWRYYNYITYLKFQNKPKEECKHYYVRLPGWQRAHPAHVGMG